MSRYVFIFLLLILVGALGLSALERYTEPHLNERHQLEQQQLAQQWLPETWCEQDCKLIPQQDLPLAQPSTEWISLQHVYTDTGERYDLHQVFAKRGYNGPIELWVLTSQTRQLHHVQLGNHKETPGIGARIEADTQWLKQSTTQVAAGLQNIDALSGATISSEAVIQTLQAIQQAAQL